MFMNVDICFQSQIQNFHRAQLLGKTDPGGALRPIHNQCHVQAYSI